ncbi:MAG: sulfatase-like hydrolase/transferase, partial [Acidobacteriota bacterium]
MKRPRIALAVPMLLLCLLGSCSREKPWNVLVVTFDTTRADFIGCYGRESASTPHIDAVAEEGYLFLDALASVPITLPSHSTLFTGTYPMFHGVRDNGLFRLPEQSVTLAEALSDAGYATGGAIGGFPLTEEFGIAQGFDFYDDHITADKEDIEGLPIPAPRQLFFDERSASKVNDAILPWLRENAEGPFFAWIHYWDPHHPHIPPAPFNQLYQHDLYQGEIAYADQNLGIVLEELKQRGVYDRTLIVLTGDHGEGRGEHREETHSLLAYNSTLKVPLIVKVPGREGGRRIEGRVGIVQVLATVLELLGLDVPDDAQGRSLVPLMFHGGEEPESRSLIYAETLSPRLSHGWGELRALYDGPFKYIHGPRQELYDLSQDPNELTDLSGQLRDEKERLEKALAAFIDREAADLAAQAAHEADDESLRRLAALGYISSSGDSATSVREELRTDGAAPQDRVADNSLSSRMKQALDRRDFLAARDYGETLLERDPGNSYYLRLATMALLGLGQLDRAAERVEGAPAMAPQNRQTYLQVASELFSSGQRERGLALARRIAEEDRHPYPLYIVAEMHGSRGDDGLYREALEQSLEVDSKFSASRLSLGVLEAREGNLEAAEELLGGLVSEFPLEPRYHFNMGALLWQRQQREEALRSNERAAELA